MMLDSEIHQHQLIRHQNHQNLLTCSHNEGQNCPPIRLPHQNQSPIQSIHAILQKKNDNDSNKDDVEVDSTLTTRKTRQMSDLCKGLASTQLSVDSASNEPVKTSRKRKLSDLCNEIDSSNETEPESANESESINDEIDEKPGNKKRGK